MKIKSALRFPGYIGLWYASCALGTLLFAVLTAAAARLWLGPLSEAEAAQRFVSFALVALPLCVGIGIATWTKYFSVRADRPGGRTTLKLRAQ
jgi:hypothetical protein